MSAKVDIFTSEEVFTDSMTVLVMLPDWDLYGMTAVEAIDEYLPGVREWFTPEDWGALVEVAGIEVSRANRALSV